MNIYDILKTAMLSDDIAVKEKLTLECLEYCTQNEISQSIDFIPEAFEKPSYALKCQIVDPGALPARKEFDTLEGLAALVHAIVRKGDKWFRYLCEKEGLSESVYFETLDRYKPLSKHRPHINVPARKEAGFTCGEIKKLGAKECL